MPVADRYRVGMRRLRGFRMGSKEKNWVWRRGNPCGCPLMGRRKTCPYANDQPISVTPRKNWRRFAGKTLATTDATVTSVFDHQGEMA